MPRYQIHFTSQSGIRIAGTLKVPAGTEQQALVRAERFLPLAVNITSITPNCDQTVLPRPNAFGHGEVNDQVPPADHEV